MSYDPHLITFSADTFVYPMLELFPLMDPPTMYWTDVVWGRAVPLFENHGAGLWSNYEDQYLTAAPERVDHHHVLASGQNAGYAAQYTILDDEGLVSSSALTQKWVIDNASSWHTSERNTGNWLFLPEVTAPEANPLSLVCMPASFEEANTARLSIRATDVRCQAYGLRIAHKAQPPKVVEQGAPGGTAAAPTDDAPVHVYFYVGGPVVDDADYTPNNLLPAYTHIYRLTCNRNSEFQISVFERPQNYTESQPKGWRLLQRVPRTERSEDNAKGYEQGQSDIPIDVECRVLGNRVIFYVGDTREEFRFPHEFTAQSWAIVAVRVVAERHLSVKIEGGPGPIYWLRATTWKIADEPIGFYNPEDPEVTFRYAQDFPATAKDAQGNPQPVEAQIDWAASSLNGPSIRYKADMVYPIALGTHRGVEYARFCRPVRSVDFKWVGKKREDLVGPGRVHPYAIETTYQFFPESLTIRTTANLSFHNRNTEVLPFIDGPDYPGRWAMRLGHMGVTVDCTVQTPIGNRTGRLFQGVANVGSTTTSKAGDSELVIHCSDTWDQLDHPRWDYPWMDGWNVYAAMAYLARMAGIPDERIGFLPYVPENPFDDLGDPDGNPAWFLPVGGGGTLISRWSGQPISAVMRSFAQSIGFLLFFDLYGVLQFRKFRIPSTPRVAFYEADLISLQVIGDATGMFDLQSVKSMRDSRTQVVTIGLDPHAPLGKEAIVYSERDDDALYDSFVYNHKGYHAPAVWAASHLADKAFATKAGREMMEILRHPSLTVSFSTWLMPDLFPMDMILVQSQAHGLVDIPLLVTGVTKRLRQYPARTPPMMSVLASYFAKLPEENVVPD